MHAIDKKRALMEDRPFVGQSIESFVVTHVYKIPELAKDELYTGRNDLWWVNKVSQERYERYMACITEKYRDDPSAMPGPLDPMDTTVWEQAIGGVKRGRVPGLSIELVPKALGFHTKKRHVLLFSGGQQTEKIQSLQATVEKLQRQARQNEEERLTLIATQERMRDQLAGMAQSQREFEERMMQRIEELWRGRFSEEHGASSQASDTVEQHQLVSPISSSSSTC